MWDMVWAQVEPLIRPRQPPLRALKSPSSFLSQSYPQPLPGVFLPSRSLLKRFSISEAFPDPSN